MKTCHLGVPAGPQCLEGEVTCMNIVLSSSILFHFSASPKFLLLITFMTHEMLGRGKERAFYYFLLTFLGKVRTKVFVLLPFVYTEFCYVQVL